MPPSSACRALPLRSPPARQEDRELLEKAVLEIAGAAICGYHEALAAGRKPDEAAVRTLQAIRARFVEGQA
ncbi:MAG: hypothetical protein ABII76_27375 [Pseudomonadota bacterium]